MADFSALNRATPLLRDAGIRTLLLHLRAGEEMPEHKVKGPISVQCLKGSVLFRTATDEADATAGSLLTLPAATVVRTGHGDSTTIGAERETLAKVDQ